MKKLKLTHCRYTSPAARCSAMRHSEHNTGTYNVPKRNSEKDRLILSFLGKLNINAKRTTLTLP